MTSRGVIVTFDDRRSSLVGIELLLLSLREFGGGRDILIFLPEMWPDFEPFLQAYPDIRHEMVADNMRGSAVKPHLLRKMIQEGYEEAIWIDSDILITSKLSPVINSRLLSTSADALLLSSDEKMVWKPNVTQGWGLDPKRSIPAKINSCFVRVTPAHTHVLERWIDFLDSTQFQEEIRKDRRLRREGFFGDQTALEASICSDPKSNVEIAFLRDGIDIAQMVGNYGWTYTIKDRLRNACRRTLPTLLHQSGVKPWAPEVSKLSYCKRVNLRLSPYTISAARYKPSLTGDSADWIHSRYTLSRAIQLLTLKDPNLAGIPIIVCAWLYWSAYRKLLHLRNLVRGLTRGAPAGRA